MTMWALTLYLIMVFIKLFDLPLIIVEQFYKSFGCLVSKFPFDVTTANVCLWFRCIKALAVIVQVRQPARTTLNDGEDNITVQRYEAAAEPGDKLAEVRSRVMQGMANKMADEILHKICRPIWK